MSQSSTLTRCPHCETRFRVTEEQLGIARGKVRCGNCMEVFNALEHSEPESPVSPSPSKPAPGADTPSSDGTGSSRFEVEDDFVFEDDPEEDAAEGNYAGTKTAFTEDELSDSFLKYDEKTSGSFGEEDDDMTSDIDESWAEAILDEDEKLSRKRAVAPEESRPETQQPPEKTKAPQPPEREPEPIAPPSHARERASQETPGFDLPDDDETLDEAERPISASPRDEHDDPLAATQRMGGAAPYDNLRYEPIAVTGQRSSWARKTLWTLVILALIGLLISQVTYFQLDRLSSVPELRPYYEQGCDILGCDLPPLVAIDHIQSQKLVVRTDPQKRDTLIVDAVIVNQAGFEQPFPNIGLTFSNLNGDVVAQSVFEPDEYLSGEAGQMERMPSQTPVRISISIRDPGRDAVNYNLSFLARDRSSSQ
ncbi:DUF3426 domain-containing protein [Marinobacter fonticola]|uniref:DUF3426 domain-containing protein n=1 Tax=Marinobacter fonticola TaxID=2603215 RepID=UPI0011E80E71|nr:DUF3426 domain-containing protein [Marinobacter fonticola]